MNRSSSCTVPSSVFWFLIGFIIIAGVCCPITTAALQPADFCPADLREEEEWDEYDYSMADETNASALLDEMNAKYCEWAAIGRCFSYDFDECSRYGVFLPEMYLSSDAMYILSDGRPGIVILLGSWKTTGNITEPVPGTDIDIRVYENGTHNIRTHKTITTGEDGQALFEWIWADNQKDGDKDWILEYSHDTLAGETLFSSEVLDTGDFLNESIVLDEYPNTPLY